MAFANTTIALDEALDSVCKHARILIVEDDPNYRFFLRQTLSKEGYQNIEQAANGNEGYHKTLSFMPDIVILDLMMPICNGIEYCQRIRAHPKFKDMPILVQTGVGDMEMHKKSFEAGATDLLTKPVNAEEFIARTRAHLERYEMTRNISNYRRVLQQELDVADSMQRHFMPDHKYIHEIERKFGLRISCHYQSTGLVGGDMWNAIALDNSRLLLYMCDFSKQGISSAMQSMRYNMLMQRTAEETTDPGFALTHLNARLRELTETGQSTLMSVMVLNVAEDSLSFAGAGAPRPIVLHSGQGGRELLKTHSTPLGLHEGELYTSEQAIFGSGDSLFLYSDGLFSTCRVDGTCLTEEEAANMASACLEQGDTLEEKHAAFHTAMCNNITGSNATLADDLLMLLISRV